MTKKIKHKYSLLSKKIDIIFLILNPFFATIISLIFNASYLFSIILYFGIPAVYLSFRNIHAIRKSFIFSSVMLIWMLLIDYLAIINKSWIVSVSVFPTKLFGVIPFEDIFSGFLLVYGVIMFYEHFLDKGRHNLKDTNLKYFLAGLIFLLIIFALAYLFKSSLFFTSYFYIKIGIALGILPMVSFLSFFPRLLSKFIKAGTYFALQGIMSELTGLSLNQWKFPSNQYIGWVNIMNFKFPLEEFLFWIVLFSTCILSYYEFFDDDRK